MTPPVNNTLKWTTPEIMLAVLFLLAPFYYQPNIGGQGLNLPGNITVWLAAWLVIWFSVWQVLKVKTIVLPAKSLLILAFPILATISGFLSGVSQPIEWFFRLIFIWGGAFFLIGLFQYGFKRSQTDRLLFILTLAGLLHALVACLQYFQPDGISIYLPKAEGVNIATGVFQQINNHANFQAMVLLISLYLINRPAIRFQQIKRISLLITVVLSAFIVFSSGSRIGLLSLILGLALLVPVCWQVLKRNRQNTSAFFLALLLGLIAAVATTGLERLLEKSERIQTEYKASERIGIYLISAELIKQKPIIGHGLGSFEGVWQFQKGDFQQRHPDFELIQSYVTHPHNELLYWQVEGGLLATLGILVSFIMILLLGWRSKARYAIALLLPLALHTQVELPMHTSATLWFVCLLLIFIVLSHARPIRYQLTLSAAMQRLLWALNHLLLAVVTIFSIHSLLAGYQLHKATKGGADLGLALANPYFSKIAEDFYMQDLFLQASQDRSVPATQIFVDWQSAEIRFRPTDLNFRYLIGGYNNLQQRQQACQWAETAAAIYPAEKDIAGFAQACRE